MKRLVSSILLVSLLLIVGCQGKTEYGECIGVVDDASPRLTYRVSKRNVILAFIFSETAIVPLYVILWGLKCPVERVEARKELYYEAH